MTTPDVNADERASERLREVIAFLLGEAPLDGCWFGEKPENERGNFWWRKHLRAAHADLSGEVRELKLVIEGLSQYSHNAQEVRELVEAAEEVCRISDRKHDAWDRLKAALTKFRPTHQEKP